VTVNGSGFTGATAVAFGGVPATSFAVAADGTIFAVAPAEAAGTVDVKVTTPSGTSSAVGADQFTFATDAGLTSVSGNNISATAGVPLSGPLVASFTDTDTSGTASQFTALISWGDGHSTIGVVQFNGYDGQHRPQFKVQGGTVVYASAGTYTITIAIYDVGGASASTTATATVTNPGGAPTRLQPVAVGTTATATHGVPFRGSVASFKGSIPGGTASSYTVSINWGNGTTTAGTVRPTGNNTFSVFGGVTYAQAGTYTVSITITDSSGASTTVTTTILVADAGPVPAEDDTDPDGSEEPGRGPARPRVLVASVARGNTGDELSAWDADGWWTEPPGEFRDGPAEKAPASPADPAPAPDRSAATAGDGPVSLSAPEVGLGRGDEAVRPLVSDAFFAAVAQAIAQEGVRPRAEEAAEAGAAGVPEPLGWEGIGAALVAVLDELFAGE
jgi:hypothetical protein